MAVRVVRLTRTVSSVRKANPDHVGTSAVVLADLRLLQNFTRCFTDMSHFNFLC